MPYSDSAWNSGLGPMDNSNLTKNKKARITVAGVLNNNIGNFPAASLLINLDTGIKKYTSLSQLQL